MDYGVDVEHAPALDLGPIRADELNALFAIFSGVVDRREGFPHRPPLDRKVFEATWVESVTTVLAARIGRELAGAYYLKPNFPGIGARIANAGYVVDPLFRRRGIARKMLEDTVSRAPLFGFDAVQFNFVFATNPARPLYEAMGWREIGRIPAAIDGGDAVIYWRSVG